MTKENGTLMTTREVADLLGVRTQTILNWASNGVITPFKSANNYMYFSRKNVYALFKKLNNLKEAEAKLDEYAELVKVKLIEKERAFKTLCKEIKGCDIYAFRRYAKLISAIAHRLVDIGEVPLTEQENIVLSRILAFEPINTLGDELGISDTRVHQIIKKLHLKLARLSSGNNKYDLLEGENDLLRNKLIALTTPETVAKPKSVYSIPIYKCGFSVRTLNVLWRLGVENIGDLSNLTQAFLLSQRGFGRVCLNEVCDILDKNFNITLTKK